MTTKLEELENKHKDFFDNELKDGISSHNIGGIFERFIRYLLEKSFNVINKKNNFDIVITHNGKKIDIEVKASLYKSEIMTKGNYMYYMVGYGAGLNPQVEQMNMIKKDKWIDSIPYLVFIAYNPIIDDIFFNHTRITKQIASEQYPVKAKRRKYAGKYNCNISVPLIYLPVKDKSDKKVIRGKDNGWCDN